MPDDPTALIQLSSRSVVLNVSASPPLVDSATRRPPVDGERAPNDRPALAVTHVPATVKGVVLLAHGGRVASPLPPRATSLALLRMEVFARRLARLSARHGLVVARLRYRVAGYNEGAPVDDVAWAIEEIDRRYASPTCLIGHSMGGRAVLRAAAGAGVVAVAALAPWCPDGEPVAQLTEREVMVIHGTNDRITYPHMSLRFALRAREITPRLCRFEVEGSGHAMLKRSGEWHSLVERFVAGSLGMEPMAEEITSAMALEPARACAVRV